MRKGLLLLASLTGVVAVIAACGAADRRSGFGADGNGDGGPGAGGNGFTSPESGPCAGLECKVATDCQAGTTTTLRGRVYDPAGANPLYNVQVYIPSGQTPEVLPPLVDSTQDPNGIACETCASTVLNPMRAALTDSSGEFVLDNVPVDAAVPVVIQVGKWRRLFKADTTKKCAENTVPEHTFRFPKNGSEGDMPQIAVTSGAYDALECLLRGIGIDDSEFVIGSLTGGHVHVYKGYGGGMGTDAQSFWTDSGQIRKYDLLLLSCEGDEHNENKGDHGAVYDYLNAGGKVFATHYHYTWFKNSPADEFKNIANWTTNFSIPPSSFDVNQDFPKGAKFAEWLQATGATTSLGKIQLAGATDSLKAINDPALGWIQNPTDPAHAKYFSFNTPLSAPVDQQCGRAVFSDVHITDKAGPTSISACGISSGGLNAQQKALEFLFFDLSSCVTDQKTDPQPPK